MTYPPTINPEKETKKITGFIKKTFKEAGKTHAIVAVSGGVDSATSLLLTATAIKPSNTLVLHLPSKSTQSIHLKHANLVTKKTKIPKKNITTINIGAIIQKSWKIIHHYSPQQSLATKGSENKKSINAKTSQSNRLRLANLTARIRMMLIYDYAKHHNALVVGTENHSEHLLGYFTRYGDEASDLEPIKHLYKTQVLQLAKELKVPNEVIVKKPTADLWPGQTDEAELGFSYQDADPILYLYKTGKSKSEIEKMGLDKKLIQKVLKQVSSNHFKHLVPYQL